MRRQRDRSLDPILERTFGWLRGLGFAATPEPDVTVGATFTSDAAVVRPTYHWHDEYADVTIARRTTEPSPYWAQVHLVELLDRAAGTDRNYDGVVLDGRLLEDVFARAALLLQVVARDQLLGRDLELLDDIIAKRPHRGVAGLDFPVTEPWAPSQEGLWFTTNVSGSAASLSDAIDASRSTSATIRATAALRLHPGLVKSRREKAASFDRLVELLADQDLDVRRAAASSLHEWNDLSVLDAILDQLDVEAGDVPSPFAAAATFLAIGQAPEVRRKVRAALDSFASRDRAAREQAEVLRWRLDDRPPRYPRVIEVWQPGPK